MQIRRYVIFDADGTEVAHGGQTRSSPEEIAARLQKAAAKPGGPFTTVYGEWEDFAGLHARQEAG